MPRRLPPLSALRPFEAAARLESFSRAAEEQHPRIEVNVNASVGLADFARDELDLAIRFGVGPWPGLACEKFLEDEYFPVASPLMNGGKLPSTPREIGTVRLMKEDRDYWQR